MVLAPPLPAKSGKAIWPWVAPASAIFKGGCARIGASLAKSKEAPCAVSLARLLIAGSVFALLFLIYVLAQSLLIATMLRSWEGHSTEPINGRTPGEVVRNLISSLALGLPLAVAGFLPRMAIAQG